MNSLTLDKKSFGLFLMALLFTSLILFWPDARLGYVLDDHYVIAQNPAVKKFSLSGIIQTGLFAPANRSLDSQLNYYRPLVTASYAVEYQLWGASPFAQRIVNLMIHLANSVLVFFLVYLLFKKPQWAVMASIFFNILPVQEWSVRYILGRGDLLMGFFSLLSLISLTFFLNRSKKAWLWSSLLLFVAAVLSKESALLNVGLVFIVTLYLTREFKRSFVVSVFFGIAAAAYYTIRLNLYPIHAASQMDLGSLLTGCLETLKYLLRYLMPWSVQKIITNGPWVVGVWALSCAGLLMVGLSRSKERSWDRVIVLFGTVWILVGGAVFLVTHSLSARLGPVLSEHFLYLGSVGFVLLLAIMIGNISSQLLKKFLFCGFVFYFLMVSSINGYYWESEEKLLRHVQRLEGRPFTVAFEQLAMRYDDNLHNVFAMIQRSKSGSTQSLWLRRLGDIYRQQNRYPEAMTALAQAADLNPHNIEAINELAVCHLELGQLAQGMKLLGGSVMIAPQQSDAYRLMGIVHYRSGQFERAIAYLKQAWGNDPDGTETSLYLMMAYYFINDQVSYLESVDRISDRTSTPDMALRFAAQELFAHGFFKETVKVITQSEVMFKNDKAMQDLLQKAQGIISSLPK